MVLFKEIKDERVLFKRHSFELHQHETKIDCVKVNLELLFAQKYISLKKAFVIHDR